MQYKTITLELLKEMPEVYEHLRSTKKLLATIDAFAINLKALHDIWKDWIRQEEPDRDPSQVASEAMELAVLGMDNDLHSLLPRDGAEPVLSLDAAMDYLRRHSPSA